jgi:hypothetical protein
MAHTPILSVSQFPPGREDGPIPFMFNNAGPLGALQGELHWRLFDFCRIHQIVYKEIAHIEEKLDALNLKDIQFTGDVESFDEYQKSRLLDAVIAKDIENKRVISFVDHMTVVGLWAIAEQFLGKVYRGFKGLTDSCKPEDVSAPYRWDNFLTEYGAIGIDLTKCENFGNADECRVLNNSIKHGPVVGSRLVTFAYFLPYQGKKLEDVPLEMQRYLNGVSDFLGSLIETANQSLTAKGF